MRVTSRILQISSVSIPSISRRLKAILELGRPTGDDDKGIGSGHLWEIEPFLSLGLVSGDVELVSLTRFGIHTNSPRGELPPGDSRSVTAERLRGVTYVSRDRYDATSRRATPSLGGTREDGDARRVAYFSFLRPAFECLRCFQVSPRRAARIVLVETFRSLAQCPAALRQ